VIHFPQIRTLLALQRRAIVNAFFDRKQRYGLLASLITGGLWYGLWITVAIICAVAPSYIGLDEIETSMPGFLLFALGYWQLSPLVTLSLGASLEMRKLALYPVSVPTLFFVECLLRLWTAVEMILVLGGLFIGIAVAGSSTAPLLAAGLTTFIAFNMFLSAGIRNLVERVFQKRRLREIILISMVALTVLPQAVVFSETARGWVRSAIRNQLDVPYWITPAGLSARLSLGQASGNDVALLLAMVTLAGVFGYRMFRASCRLSSASTAGEQAPRTANAGRVSWVGRLARLFPDPLGALIEKEIHYLWRSPRFRLPFFMGFTFGVIAWAPIVLRVEGPLGKWLQSGATSFISLYAMLLLGPVLFLNRFGFDRAATRFYFWMPLSFRQLLGAKNAATAFYCFAETFAVIAIARIIGLPVGWTEALETLVAVSVALLYLLSVGNHMSVRFPVASNPDRVSRAGAGHGIRAAAQFFLFPLALFPVLSAFVSRYAGAGDFFWILLALAAVGGLALYSVVFGYATRYGLREREFLLSNLSGGEGPLAAE